MIDIKLTQFSPGAGCGCKISPIQLETILKTKMETVEDPLLLVGNESRDDAAVYDLGNGTAIISTTDFFMPITDNAFDFGRIASANAISDIYAMGGKPLMAISILGWPLSKLPPETAAEVLDGARSICNEAEIPLAGGHSIDSLEPIFGLAVTGIVNIDHLKKNNTAQPGDLLYLTKPLGIGILSTAEKNGILKPEHACIARNFMVKLNKIGAELGHHAFIHAMTDVTGFGLLGHLIEMAEGSDCVGELNFSKVPVIPEAREYISLNAIPGGTKRNWKSYNHKVSILTDEQRTLLCDPQTSGGLLIAVSPEHAPHLEMILIEYHIEVHCIGNMRSSHRQLPVIMVI